MQPRYRGWDTARKVMYSPDEMGKDEVTINPDGRGFVNVSGQATMLSQYLHHIIPLQSTGHYDVKGTEIFEGDIITRKIDEKEGRSVEQKFEIVWSKEEGGFLPRAQNGWEPIFRAIIQSKDLSVLGNVYQNSDLWQPTESD